MTVAAMLAATLSSDRLVVWLFLFEAHVEILGNKVLSPD